MTAKLQLTGFVTKDVRTIDAGDSKLSFISVADSFKDKTTFYDVKAFHNKVNVPADLKKGDKVLVEGAFAVEKNEHDGREYVQYSLYAWNIFKVYYARKPKDEKKSEVKDSAEAEENDADPEETSVF
jgi:single-stranded DNA-binding protein